MKCSFTNTPRVVAGQWESLFPVWDLLKHGNYETLPKKWSIAPDITLRGPRTVHVIHRSNRFAAVEIKGANYDVHLSGEFEGLSQFGKFSLDSSCILLLKKRRMELGNRIIFYLKK